MTGSSLLFITMQSFAMFLVFLFGLFLFISPAVSQSCSKLLTIGATTKNFTHCQRLPVQGASLAWTFSSKNSTLAIGFSGTLPSSSGWVGWGYNPEGPNMSGSSALVAFNYESKARVFLYNLTNSAKGGAALIPTNFTKDVSVIDSAASIEGGTGAVNLTAILRLSNNNSNVFHVWNRGSMVNGTSPRAHSFNSENLQSAGSLNLTTSL